MQRIHKKRMIMIISIIIGSILFVFLLGKLVTFVGYSIDVRSGMLNYLENKYDQEFKCLSFSGHDWFAQPADMKMIPQAKYQLYCLWTNNSHIWHYVNATKEGCFINCTALSNYSEIPDSWK